MLIRSSCVSLLLAASWTAAANCDLASVELKLLPQQSVCGAIWQVETAESGVLAVGFQELDTAAEQGKYLTSCRLAGELVIPKGYRLDPGIMLHARVSGELKGGIDNVTGRLKISLGRYTGRDFELVEQADAENPVKSVTMDLQVQLPDVPHSCAEDLTWPVYLFVESTVNGKASSRIEGLKLDRLKLLPMNCPR